MLTWISDRDFELGKVTAVQNPLSNGATPWIKRYNVCCPLQLLAKRQARIPAHRQIRVVHPALGKSCFACPNGDGASSWRASREREWLSSPDYVIEKEVNFYQTRVRVIAEQTERLPDEPGRRN